MPKDDGASDQEKKGIGFARIRIDRWIDWTVCFLSSTVDPVEFERHESGDPGTISRRYQNERLPNNGSSSRVLGRTIHATRHGRY